MLDVSNLSGIKILSNLLPDEITITVKRTFETEAGNVDAVKNFCIRKDDMTAALIKIGVHFATSAQNMTINEVVNMFVTIWGVIKPHVREQEEKTDEISAVEEDRDLG